MKSKAMWNKLIGEIKKSDIVIEVVDIRCVECTRNKKIEKIVLKEGKHLIIAISKMDVVPEEYHKKIKQDLESKLKEEYNQNNNIKVLLFSYKQRKGAINIKKAIYEIKDKIQQGKKEEGDIKVFIVGYPNTGKSTLINLLTREQKARHSPKPGLTRGVQWIRLKKGVMLVDSPGVIPAEEGLEVLKNNFDPDKEESYGEAINLIKTIKQSTWSNITEILNLPPTLIKEKEEKIIEEYAKNKNLLLKGGKLDLERASKDIIRKWNKGELAALIMHQDK